MVKNQWFRQEWVQPGLKIPGSTWAQHATTAYAFIFCCSIWLTLTPKAGHGFCRGSVWRGLADGVLSRCRSSFHSWGEVFGSKFVKFTNLQIFRDFAQFRGTISAKITLVRRQMWSLFNFGKFSPESLLKQYSLNSCRSLHKQQQSLELERSALKRKFAVIPLGRRNSA